MVMNIKGLDYNTSRKKLEMPEYGREVQKLVDHALTIADPTERQACAETIVKIMQRVSPPASRDTEARRKYWDHLAIMSGFKLDINYPFDIEQAKQISEKPQPLNYPQQRIPVRHYGALMFELLDKLKTMPAGPERDKLAEVAANQMKRSLMTFGQGNVSEEKVAEDLAYFTDGVIQLDLDTFRFAHVNSGRAQTDRRKKKK